MDGPGIRTASVRFPVMNYGLYLIRFTISEGRWIMELCQVSSEVYDTVGLPDLLPLGSPHTPIKVSRTTPSQKLTFLLFVNWFISDLLLGR